MEQGTLDRLATRLGEEASRRRLLGGLMGTAAALAGAALVGTGGAEAGKNGKGQRNDKVGPKDRPKNRGFRSAAAGVVTEPAAEGCQLTGDQRCTTEFAGEGNASHMGKVGFVSSLTADWSQATSNGEGGFCAPVTGVSTLTSANNGRRKKSSLDLEISGTVCEDGATGEDVPLLLEGEYTIVGGTGKLKDAAGTGTVEGSVVGENAEFTASGKIVY